MFKVILTATLVALSSLANAAQVVQCKEDGKDPVIKIYLDKRTVKLINFPDIIPSDGKLDSVVTQENGAKTYSLKFERKSTTNKKGVTKTDLVLLQDSGENYKMTGASYGILPNKYRTQEFNFGPFDFKCGNSEPKHSTDSL